MAQALGKAVLHQSRHALVFIAVSAALLAWGGREVTLTGTPDPSLDRKVAMGQWAQDSIDAQLVALGCDKAPRLAARVAVRNSAQDNAGNVQFDTTVVRVVTFDKAYGAAKAGAVWVVGYCG